ncbi:hypothetical protein HRM2_21670 [Desulforapulum autotrophicum HRM2]|uniref:Recombinase domain-containing protein n=1 Tax=Desulforapulum autotrophicum (strain ATCC 43914 / DSM 3382 / VKM B-1955 / HRM2) TaxID=177437 RepID=C0QDK1_DESAH|nr:hypothetical protein [Desulforapulum autotrophicum]ACN15265.1 hypothetical protein HRM2_21670 [Desulforapulum autotrophicum HRM2]
MSDFLKNLRSTHRGAPPRPSGPTRKEIGDRYGLGSERRKMTDRRGPFPPQSQYKETDETTEYLPIIKESIATMAASLERMAENQESLIQAQIKQHESVGTFFENLNQILMDRVVPTLDAASQSKPIQKGTTSYASGTHHTKDEVIEIIRDMRKKRSTFAEIAQALMDKGIPTFSGRGDWHAQTIHRLCKES